MVGNALHESGVAALFQAAWDNRTDVLERLLSQGIDVNALNGRGEPALYAAIENNVPEAAECLLRNGASVHRLGAMGGWTPLGCAVQDAVIRITDRVDLRPDLRVVTTLVRHGADPRVSAPPLNATSLEYAKALCDGGVTEVIGRALLAAFSERTIE